MRTRQISRAGSGRARISVAATLAVGALLLGACRPGPAPEAPEVPAPPAAEEPVAEAPAGEESLGDGGGLEEERPAEPPAAPAKQAKGTKPALSGGGAIDMTALGKMRGWAPQIMIQWNDARASAQHIQEAKGKGFPPFKAGDVAWYTMAQLWSVNANAAGGKWKGALAVNFPMWATGENATQCAQGKNNESRTRILNNLKQAWGPDAWINLGWEGNSGYQETQGMGNIPENNATQWKACWANWHKLIKQVSPDFKLVWVANVDGITNVLDYLPDAKYLDAAGADLYARNRNGGLKSLTHRAGPKAPEGIRAWWDEIAKRGLPLAVPEWGPVNNGTDWGSGDNPEYMRQMRALFEEAAASKTGLAFEALFDGGDGYNCAFSMLPEATGCNKNPKSRAVYKELWSKGPYKTS